MYRKYCRCAIKFDPNTKVTYVNGHQICKITSWCYQKWTRMVSSPASQLFISVTHSTKTETRRKDLIIKCMPMNEGYVLHPTYKLNIGY